MSQLSMSNLPQGLSAKILSWVGGPVQRRLAQWSPLLAVIAAFEDDLQKHTDQELRKRSLSLRFRAKSGESLASLLPEGFALVRESGRAS